MLYYSTCIYYDIDNDDVLSKIVFYLKKIEIGILSVRTGMKFKDVQLVVIINVYLRY